MGRLSDDIVDSLLDEVFGAVSYSPPSTIYVGLSTTTPANDGTGVTEPSGGAYARVAVTNNTTNWPSASSRAKSNGTAITFPTATGVWGVVTHVVFYDASTSGNYLGSTALNTPQSLGVGAIPNFPVGSISITAPGS
jgi:hypothetical protein